MLDRVSIPNDILKGIYTDSTLVDMENLNRTKAILFLVGCSRLKNYNNGNDVFTIPFSVYQDMFEDYSGDILDKDYRYRVLGRLISTHIRNKNKATAVLSEVEVDPLTETISWSFNNRYLEMLRDISNNDYSLFNVSVASAIMNVAALRLYMRFAIHFNLLRKYPHKKMESFTNKELRVVMGVSLTTRPLQKNFSHYILRPSLEKLNSVLRVFHGFEVEHSYSTKDKLYKFNMVNVGESRAETDEQP